MAVTDEELIAELCEIEGGMTDWEVQFVESVARQGKWLSGAQRTKAEQILQERGGEQ